MSDVMDSPGGALPPKTQVALYLRQQVADGRLAAGDEIPSRSVLAKKFGVSARTVSNALRMLTASGLVEHVPGKGVFVAGGRGQAEPQTLQTIGLIGEYASRLKVGERMHRDVDYGEGILNALARYAHEAGMNVLLIPQTAREPFDVERVLACGTDCVVSLGIELRRETVIRLREARIPLVLGNQHLEHLGVSYVDFDTEGCFARAVDIFHERGHRRIATITHTFRTKPIGPRCRRAFYMALADHGLGYCFRDYYREFGIHYDGAMNKAAADEQQEAARHACHEMLDYPEPPTAFYTHDHVHADGILRAAKERGLVIGKDLSLLTDSWRSESEPLSHLRGHQDVLGRELVETVKTLLQKPYEVCQTAIPKVFTDNGSIATLEP